MLPDPDEVDLVGGGEHGGRVGSTGPFSADGQVGYQVHRFARNAGPADYAKNVWDLGNSGIDLSAADDIDWLKDLRDQTSSLIAGCARIYRERDEEAAHSLIPKMDVYLDEFDACTQRQIDSSDSPREAVPRALLCRYLKRITAHLMNVLTSLVMPVHRLDFYDEAKADRPNGD